MTKKRKWLKKLGITFLLVVICGVLAAGIIVYRQVQQVRKWQPEVEEASKKYGISEYSEIALAIIYTESKGNHVDVMQSSESRYGVRNQITTTEESIDSGVEHLAEVIKAAEAKNCDIWTAVQAYNFGTSYIDYVASHGHKETIDLAKVYSRDVLAPLLGNHTKETYFYKHPLALLNNRGMLYKNGGNFLYAESVKMNLTFLKLFS
ncbi:hypothetical protein CBF34_02830 [Vagococcus penaei]|uniref:Uncharacterized protein n=1 Tax=Vagococcus penaei TaxID=633807 RepID=A0A1Q2D418_9ENTE|nr:lysozyme family protein [Vagococcus penaei]AQP53073.1 hypothetical protein BW732_01755 [Vagococcus penaei]RSU06064.1 hypothetical protein CBF34_02830 [Vagococcus penaei]